MHVSLKNNGKHKLYCPTCTKKINLKITKHATRIYLYGYKKQVRACGVLMQLLEKRAPSTTTRTDHATIPQPDATVLVWGTVNPPWLPTAYIIPWQDQHRNRQTPYFQCLKGANVSIPPLRKISKRLKHGYLKAKLFVDCSFAPPKEMGLYSLKLKKTYFKLHST